jgi:Flp pilus assembly protein TadG
MMRQRVRRVEWSSDEGSYMPMVAIVVVFLMVASFTLISATQQWNARREARSIAAAAARAGAQGNDSGRAEFFDPTQATQRAQAVLGAAGAGGSVRVQGTNVTVTVTMVVAYTFPAPGLPGTVEGTSTAGTHRGVSGSEGG